MPQWRRKLRKTKLTCGMAEVTLHATKSLFEFFWLAMADSYQQEKPLGLFYGFADTQGDLLGKHTILVCPRWSVFLEAPLSESQAWSSQDPSGFGCQVIKMYVHGRALPCWISWRDDLQWDGWGRERLSPVGLERAQSQTSDMQIHVLSHK